MLMCFAPYRAACYENEKNDLLLAKALRYRDRVRTSKLLNRVTSTGN